jgi:hypothetical protein
MSRHSYQQLPTRIQADTSFLEKNLIYLLLGELQGDYPLQTQYYKIPIDKLQQLYGQSINNHELIEATQNILLRKYLIKDGKQMLSTSFISSATSITEENMVEVGVSSMVYPYLLKLRERCLNSLTAL